MRMRDLQKRGIPKPIIDIWCETESEDLLPIQDQAIAEHGVLDGQSVVIAAPSSAGKTFVAEVAAVASSLRRKHTLFLVSHKAIAEEKFADFRRKYSAYGLKVIISTGDQRTHDDALAQGDFQIAVLTYEKCMGFLVTSPQVVEQCSLLVVDEVQTLSDPERGPNLELLLTRVRTLAPDLQIIALSGVLPSPNRLDEWLGATFVQSDKRPIPLREGICRTDGTVRYWDAARGSEATERLGDFQSEDIDQLIVKAVKALVTAGEQVLVFAPTRPESERLAKLLASALALESATAAIERVGESEPSPLQDDLIRVLERGVAFHNADLLPGERFALEDSYRKGEVRLMVSTSTLAMGVNMPAKTVIIADPIKYVRDPMSRRSVKENLSVAEYKNMIGRAGRYKWKDEFGRSLLIALTQHDEDSLWESYVAATPEELQPRFGERTISRQVLFLVASGVAETQEGLAAFLSRTYSHLVDSEGLLLTTLDSDVAAALGEAKELALVVDEDGRLTATNHGALCAQSGLEMETYAELRDWATSSESDPDDFLATLASATEVADKAPRLTTAEFRAGRATQAFEALRAEMDLPEGIRYLADQAADYDQANQLRAALGMTMWSEEGTLRNITRVLGLRGARVRALAEQASRLAETTADIARIEDLPHEFIANLRLLARRLVHGVRADCLELAELRLRHGSRGLYRRLVDEGVCTPEQVLDMPLGELSRLVPRRIAEELKRRSIQGLEDEYERHKYRHLARISKVARDGALLQRLYEQTGEDLSRAVAEILNSDQLNITARHITRQRRGEVDVVAETEEETRVAISVTASDRNSKPIGLKKAGEVLAGGARYKPDAYVVIGRPRFHDDAVANADSIVRAGTNYKLIPMDVFAEMYVRVLEGDLPPNEFRRILAEERGVISMEFLG